MLPEWAEQALNAFAELEDYAERNVEYSVLVKLDQQKLYLLRDNNILNEYPISSSKFGVGNEQGSHKTPLGIHHVAEKIGGNCRFAEIIKARVPTGQVAELIQEASHGEADIITSRILWLEGLQSGFNRGPGVDSYQRYIYIHGTAEEGLVGQPASIGCIRMKNQDVIDLYNKLPLGALVNILK